MNIILLSGGSGKRLWPLSNNVKSKQFIKILKNNDGTYESMVQRIFRQIRNVDSEATITIATSKTQVPILNDQLGENVGMSIEPCRRDTFPAIALATAYIHEVQSIPEDEVVVVCPVDPYVNEEYFKELYHLWKIAQDGISNLYLMGINPTYPSEKYGYIMPCTNDKVSKVESFKEKPSTQIAQKYMEQGALWNGGVFAYKIKYVLNICKKIIGTANYNELLLKYEDIKKISFDYAVVEKEKNISVMKFSGEWRDIGTWNTLCDAMQEKLFGKKIISEKCKNTYIINELDIPIICMGLENIIVSVCSNGILVSDKEMSSSIKPLVEKIESKNGIVERVWGDYRILDISEKSMIIKMKINPMQYMNYYNHTFKIKSWTIIDGEGWIVIDDVKKTVALGDVITIKPDSKYTIIAGNKQLEILGVQLEKNL